MISRLLLYESCTKLSYFIKYKLLEFHKMCNFFSLPIIVVSSVCCHNIFCETVANSILKLEILNSLVNKDFSTLCKQILTLTKEYLVPFSDRTIL